MFLSACFLLVLIHSLASSDRMAFSSAHDAKKEYSNVWAVEVTGGKLAADELARKHGFTNKGQVGSLKDMYHFVLDGGTEEHMPRMTEALRAEPSIKYVEQQKYVKHVKKNRH